MIKARKLSSALSAAKAICDHMHDWWFGTADVSNLLAKFVWGWRGRKRRRGLCLVV